MRSLRLELPPSSSTRIAPRASGTTRPGLEACLKALRAGDTLVIWKLDRLGRNLKHLVDVVQGLNDRGVGLKVLAGQGASIDTTTANGRLMFNFFAALAEFERTVAGLAAAARRAVLQDDGGEAAAGAGRDGQARDQHRGAVRGTWGHAADALPTRHADR